MRTLVVTAANEAFQSMLQGLVESLHQWEPRPFTDLAFLDVGLSPASLAWLRRFTSKIVVPEWDLPLNEKLRQEKPFLRAMTGRPFLPKYFPGYDIYIWIDCDAWVQERFALDWLVAAAATGNLAIVPQVDPAYRHTPASFDWRITRMRAYFGPEAANRVLWDRYYNSGVFALRADAIHWESWAKWFRQGMAHANGSRCEDQTSLNQAIWMDQLPVTVLPALCNWLCHLALPTYHVERGKFCEPTIPIRPLGILHLSGNSKDARFNLPSGESAIGLGFRKTGAVAG